jgi:hypothetical protein
MGQCWLDNYLFIVKRVCSFRARRRRLKTLANFVDSLVQSTLSTKFGCVLKLRLWSKKDNIPLHLLGAGNHLKRKQTFLTEYKGHKDFMPLR